MLIIYKEISKIDFYLFAFSTVTNHVCCRRGETELFSSYVYVGYFNVTFTSFFVFWILSLSSKLLLKRGDHNWSQCSKWLHTIDLGHGIKIPSSLKIQPSLNTFWHYVYFLITAVRWADAFKELSTVTARSFSGMITVNL